MQKTQTLKVWFGNHLVICFVQNAGGSVEKWRCKMLNHSVVFWVTLRIFAARLNSPLTSCHLGVVTSNKDIKGCENLFWISFKCNTGSSIDVMCLHILTFNDIFNLKLLAKKQGFVPWMQTVLQLYETSLLGIKFHVTSCRKKTKKKQDIWNITGKKREDTFFNFICAH